MNFDAIVVGGSFAGLSAATYLARARLSVCVIDTGKPRNRFATHSHGFLSQDGSNPAAILETARSQVAAYPTVVFERQAAVAASGEIGNFTVTLADGRSLGGRHLVLAFGLSDDLPDIPGLAERWGNSVIHCPYCHGYEFSNRRLGVLNLSPVSMHQAMLIPQWGPTTLYLNGGPEPDAQTTAELLQRGVRFEHGRVTALRGRGSDLAAVELEDGRRVETDALFIGPPLRFNSDLAGQIGCDMQEGPLGFIIRTDDVKQTSVPGTYAAGDITRGAHAVTFACADGVTAATAIHRSIVFPAA